MLNIPILFIVFNRLNTAKRVFYEIRLQKPKYLFLAADGPRRNNPNEENQCMIVREYILNHIDWDCNVKTLFRKDNLGCGLAVSGAIDWFFSNISEGIILEDDCLPSSSFFGYCERLLERYRNNEKIMHIAGNNPLPKQYVYDSSYYFSRIQHCWGWASWKRAWDLYSYNIEDLFEFKNNRAINRVFRNKAVQEYWLDIFEKMEKHEIDTWDYQWTYSIIKNNGFCINPSINLISNIGFGDDSTHTSDTNSRFSNQKIFEIKEFVHPQAVKINNAMVNRINKNVFGIRYRPIKRSLRWIKYLIRRIFMVLFNCDIKKIYHNS